jgi:hypothetical protein
LIFVNLAEWALFVLEIACSASYIAAIVKIIAFDQAFLMELYETSQV